VFLIREDSERIIKLIFIMELEHYRFMRIVYMKLKCNIFLTGILGLLVLYVCIFTSIALSPWFSWSKYALSDLGHSAKSIVAPIFNLGLVAGGFLIYQYSISILKHSKMITYYFLALSAFLLMLIGVFDEVYGILHFIVSVAFFITALSATLIYAYERKSKVAVVAFIIGICSWTIYGLKVFEIGISVPEILSAFAVTSWIIEDVYLQSKLLRLE